jgi:hypothetical protein
MDDGEWMYMGRIKGMMSPLNGLQRSMLSWNRHLAKLLKVRSLMFVQQMCQQEKTILGGSFVVKCVVRERKW